MAVFKSFQPGVEVNSETILSFLDGMEGYKTLLEETLRKYGIQDLAPGKWYSQQAWLNAFKEISEKAGPETLRRIGTNIPNNAKWPPEVNSIASALQSIDVAYHMNHRNGEIGRYAVTAIRPHSATLVCNNPYPCAFDQGIIVAAAKKFAGPGDIVSLKHDESGFCRMSGYPSCTYTVTW